LVNCAQEGVAARALEFTILTAARTGETIGATWDEVSASEKVWTIPAERMKAGKDHRVPLSSRALAILRDEHDVRTSGYVFPGGKAGKPLSNMAMTEVLRRMGRSNITVHGFRSTFRDWAASAPTSPTMWSRWRLPTRLATRKLPTGVAICSRSGAGSWMNGLGTATRQLRADARRSCRCGALGNLTVTTTIEHPVCQNGHPLWAPMRAGGVTAREPWTVTSPRPIRRSTPVTAMFERSPTQSVTRWRPPIGVATYLRGVGG